MRPQDEAMVAQNQELHDKMMARDNKDIDPLEYNTYTSWGELSSHQAAADSLNLASSYGYITTQF